ncbi:MAG: Ig-like domain-containing protein [Armatimonadota bacterium]
MRRLILLTLLGLPLVAFAQFQPVFQSGTPAPNSVNVPVTTQVILDFTDQSPPFIGSASQVILTDTTTNTAVPGSTSVSYAYQVTTLTFTPNAPLAPGRIYRVTVALVDPNNTPLTPLNFPPNYIFTTACTFNFVSGTPAPGATGVSRTPTIELRFSCNLNPSSTVTLLQGNAPVPGTSVVSGDTITFTPSAPLNYNTTYTISAANIRDVNNNPPSGFPSPYTFTTELPPPLNLVSSVPAANATNVPINTTITLTFDQPLDSTSTIAVSSASGAVAGTITIAGATITFTPSAPLAYNTVYTVDFANVRSALGAPPAGTTTFTFTTQPPPPLNLVSSSPAANATNVPISTAITLTFDQNLDSTSTITVSSASGSVAGTITITGATLTFTPSAPLAFNTTYTVDFSNVRSVLGAPPAGATTFTFTTQPPQTINLISSTPAPNATNVSINTTITLTFDQNLATTSTITVSSNAGAVAGTISISGATLTFTPSVSLAYNTTYTVDFLGVRSVFGAAPSGTTSFTFTTQPPPTVRLISSTPAAGATNVPLNTSIVLNFDGAINPASTFVVRGANAVVPGTITFSNSNQTLTFTPTVPLDPATTYTVDFSGLTTQLGGPLQGPYTFTFTTAGGARIVGVSLPQTAQAGVNETVNLSYQLRNQSAIGAQITGSTVYYYLPNGTLLAQLNQPVSGDLPPNGVFTVASVVPIDEPFVNAARNANADTLLIVRVFTGSDENGNPLRSLTDTPFYTGFVGNRVLFAQGIVVVTPVRLLNSLSASAYVEDITLTFPTPDQIVARNTPLAGRALLRVRGNGIIIGRWLVNGIPTESFSVSAVAGLPVEVSTQRGLPTLNIGEHRVELEIISPNAARSRAIRYIVSGLIETGVPRPLTPRRGAVVSARAPEPLVYRWQVVPGASGYEVGFAENLADLGLDTNGQPLEVAPNAFAPNRLLVYRRIDSPLVNSLTLTDEEYERLSQSRSGIVFWAVRPLLPPDNRPAPLQTAPPSWIVLVDSEAQVTLQSPAQGARVRLEELTFRWQPMGAGTGTLYLLEVFEGGNLGAPLLQALTSDTFYEYDVLVPTPLQRGRTYQWRVQVIVPGVGAIATSELFSFTVEPGASARLFITRVAPYHFELAQQAQVVFKPADGETVTTQQPAIRVQVPDAQPGRVRLYLDMVDMSRLAQFTEDEVRLDLPRVLEPGEHELLLVYIDRDGQRREARARFRVDLGGRTPQVESRQPDSEAAQVMAQLRLQLDSQFLARNEEFSWDNFTQSITTDGAYGSRTEETEGSLEVTGVRPARARYDINRLLGVFAYRQERFRAAIGDVGVQASAFTVSGLGTRAFQTSFTIGDWRFSYTKTIGTIIGRSGAGNSVNMWVATLETLGFAQGKGFRLIRTDSLQSYSSINASISGVAQNTHARVWSLVGQYPLSKGVRVQGEVARSENTVPLISGGEAHYRGDARTLSLQAQLPRGWNANLSYRNIEASFRSPAAQTLASDLVGYDATLTGALNRYMNLSLQYGNLENKPSANNPKSTNTNWSATLTVNLPRLLPLNLSYRQTDSESDALPPNTRRAKIRDRQYTIGTTARFGNLDTFINYTFAKFEDFFDVQDPNTDIPNERETRFVSVGVGYRVGNLALRADWSDNKVNRFARDPILLNLLRGDDTAANWRLQGEYQFGGGWSLSGVVARAEQRDLLRLGFSRLLDYSIRLNFAPPSLAGGRFQFSLEWRQTETRNGNNTQTNTLWVFLLNDSRLFSLR